MNRLAKWGISLLLLIMLGYVVTPVVWAWRQTYPLAQEAMQSPYEPLSDEQMAILLKVVDEHFYEHAGLSFRRGQGLQTISSEVADILYLEGATLQGINGYLQRWYRFTARCCQIFDPSRYARAVAVDLQLTKEEQLRIFLSNVYLGHYESAPVYGFPSAALVYFDVPLAALSYRDWVRLVAMVMDPQRLSPDEGNAHLADRVKRIERLLKGMCRPQGVMDRELRSCQDNDLISQLDEPAAE